MGRPVGTLRSKSRSACEPKGSPDLPWYLGKLAHRSTKKAPGHLVGDAAMASPGGLHPGSIRHYDDTYVCRKDQLKVFTSSVVPMACDADCGSHVWFSTVLATLVLLGLPPIRPSRGCGLARLGCLCVEEACDQRGE